MLSRDNTIKLSDRTFTECLTDIELRYAFEPRHESFFTGEFVELLRSHNDALVIADTGGKWTYAEDVTADFVYIRLHGEDLYLSDYSDQSLDRWASRIKLWQEGGEPADVVKIVDKKAAKRNRDVYVYFDNSMAAHAPRNAMYLMEQLKVSL